MWGSGKRGAERSLKRGGGHDVAATNGKRRLGGCELQRVEWKRAVLPAGALHSSTHIARGVPRDEKPEGAGNANGGGATWYTGRRYGGTSPERASSSGCGPTMAISEDERAGSGLRSARCEMPAADESRLPFTPRCRAASLAAARAARRARVRRCRCVR